MFGHPSPWRAWMNLDDCDLVRLEMTINGHWHRPPVGMRADQASHEWRLPNGAGYGSLTDFYYTHAMTLEPRQ